MTTDGDSGRRGWLDQCLTPAVSSPHKGRSRPARVGTSHAALVLLIALTLVPIGPVAGALGGDLNLHPPPWVSGPLEARPSNHPYAGAGQTSTRSIGDIMVPAVTRVTASNATRGWVQRNISNPPARVWGSMADDPADNGTLLFGGTSATNSGLNDTWLYRGGRWTETCSGTSRPPSCPVSPSARDGAWVNYDAAEHEVILVGGVSADLYANTLNDTWGFRNGTWTNLTGAIRPPSGWVVYDGADGYLLDYYAPTGLTWKFSNGNWSQVQTSSSTPSSIDAMFYDSADRKVILWNGETWAYGSGNWSRLSPATSPPGGNALASTYDSGLRYGILFGPKGSGDDTTWVFANGTWSNATTELGRAPPDVTNPAIAYDSTDGYTVLFDELIARGVANETWLLRDPLTVSADVSATLRDVGQAASFTFNLSGGVRPYNLFVQSEPPGCGTPANTTNSTTLFCVLNRSGTFQMRANITDSLQVFANVTLPLQVNPQLVGNSTATPMLTTVGIPVRFTGAVAGGTPPILVHWSFSDGSSSYNLTVSHAFGAPGVYEGVFATLDAVGEMVESDQWVQVNPGIALQAASNVNVTDVGLPVSFNASATGGTSPIAYTWQFGDGNVSGSPDVTHVFETAGIFTPRIWANDSVGASSSRSVRVVIHPALMTNASSNTSRAVEGTPVSFTTVTSGGTPPYNFSWDFGDGGNASGASVSHSFRLLGTHVVLVEVNDSVGMSVEKLLTVDVVKAGASNSQVPPTNATSGATGYSVDIVMAAGVTGLILGTAIGALLIGRRRGRPPTG